MDTRIANSWIRELAPAADSAVGEDVGVRVLFLPYAGGAASFYTTLARSLVTATNSGGRIDTLAAQYPGRQDRLREVPMTSVHDIAITVAEAITQVSATRTGPDAPLIVFGHSMGAAVGFELVRELERRGDIDVAGLIASGRRAPSTSRPERISGASRNEFIAYIRSLGGADPRLFDDPEIVDMIMPSLRGDYRAIDDYVGLPSATVEVPVSVYRGSYDDQTTDDEIAAWQRHTRAKCTVTTFVGGHFFLNERRDAVASAIRTDIDRWAQSSAAA